MSLTGGCGSMTETSSTAASSDDPGQPAQRGAEAALAKAFVRLADTLASDFVIVDFLQVRPPTRWRSSGPRRPG